MQNYKQTGDVMTFTAPTGGVVSGVGYKIGQLFVVALVSAAVGLPFAGQVTGVVTLPKNATQALTEGALLYWDNTAKNVTTTATANLLIGCSAAVATAAATSVDVRLNGTARADG